MKEGSMKINSSLKYLLAMFVSIFLLMSNAVLAQDDSKSNPPDEECEKESSKMFGPIVATFGAVDPQAKLDDGWCKYVTNTAKISIPTAEKFGVKAKSFTAPDGVTISWEQKESAYRNVKITWTGDEKIADFEGFQPSFKKASLQVNTSGEVTGKIDFHVELLEDKVIKNIAYLKKGFNGDFSYTFSSSAGSGWDFGGLKKFKVVLKKKDENGALKEIAYIDAKSMTANGEITNAVFKVTKQTYKTASFTATLDSITIGFDWKLGGQEFKLNDGKAQVTLSKIKNIKDGKAVIKLSMDSETLTGSVDATKLEAFGFKFSGNITTKIDTAEWDIESITGKNISATNIEIPDTNFQGVNFVIKAGELESFSMKSSEFKYQTIEFDFANVTYNKGSSGSDAYLEFDATVTLPNVTAKVKEFRISTVPSITMTELHVNVAQKPVTAEGHLKWFDEDHSDGPKFDAAFKGKLGKFMSVDGTAIVGAKSFNYGYFKFGGTIPSKGIPLASTGVLLKGLSAEFGFNWLANKGGTPKGTPTDGQYVLGMGATIGDALGMADLKIDAAFQMGVKNEIEISGKVNVPAGNSPNFTGTVAAKYDFDTAVTQGKLSAAVKIPSGSGSIFNLDESDITFILRSSVWSANTDGISGTFFNEVDFSTRFTFLGNYTSGTTGITSGTAKGTLDYNLAQEYTHDWNNGDCTWFGFGFTGDLNIDVKGSFEVALDNSSYTGTIKSSVKGSNTLKVRWPGIDNDCQTNYDTSIEGTIEFVKSGTSTVAKASLVFESNGEKSDVEKFNITLL
jgi:hypothetical protein